MPICGAIFRSSGVQHSRLPRHEPAASERHLSQFSLLSTLRKGAFNQVVAPATLQSREYRVNIAARVDVDEKTPQSDVHFVAAGRPVVPPRGASLPICLVQVLNDWRRVRSISSAR